MSKVKKERASSAAEWLAAHAEYCEAELKLWRESYPKHALVIAEAARNIVKEKRRKSKVSPHAG